MRIWATLVLFILVVPLFAAEDCAGWDRKDWQYDYQQALQNITAHRLLVGYPNFTFKPDKSGTYYEAAAIFSRMVWFYDLYLPERQWLPPDVPWNHWAADACQILTASRLVPTPRGTNFGGNRELSRGEFSLMAWNLVQVLQGNTPSKRLGDVDNPYFHSAKKLQEMEILPACPNGHVHPDWPMKRWQICIAVYRLVLWNEKQDGPALWGPVMYVPNYGGRRPEYR